MTLPIRSDVHIALDYVLAFTMLIAPTVLHLEGTSRILSLGAGAGLLVLIWTTSYRSAARAKPISIRVHRWFEFLTGMAFFAASLYAPALAEPPGQSFLGLVGLALLAIWISTDYRFADHDLQTRHHSHEELSSTVEAAPHGH